MSNLVLNALTVGNGILAICPMPGRGGGYAEDLELLREWTPSLVITLATLAELVAEGADRLGTDMIESGCRWAHLPVPDFGVPDGDFEQHWPDISRAALAALNGGGRVVIHCMGGCGRSGMVALRLMIEAGEVPRAALRRLRAARPCAVETQAQLDWAVTPIPSG
ncbi:protein-tyrosine phosphatase family protein [Thalassovita aquimarina]|uniref:Dual specificity protein phosphatase family protein n=1 Tax=Thalassovita aquimarina TaxID=2785917 RepID=A0ABS5HQB1_9RHOB|nr:protein-tyrosine phosphatase family protein [Thalassovita aquimarina]MBR9651135.1 dual specificity protein phosphatase family protein [Thalassovita aquimarina]